MPNLYPITYDQITQETPQPIYSPTPVFPIQPYQSTQMAPQYNTGSQQQTFSYSPQQESFIAQGGDPYRMAYNNGTIDNYMNNMNQMSMVQPPQMQMPQMQTDQQIKDHFIKDTIAKAIFGVFTNQMPGYGQYQQYQNAKANKQKKLQHSITTVL